MPITMAVLMRSERLGLWEAGVGDVGAVMVADGSGEKPRSISQE